MTKKLSKREKARRVRVRNALTDARAWNEAVYHGEVDELPPALLRRILGGRTRSDRERARRVR